MLGSEPLGKATYAATIMNYNGNYLMSLVYVSYLDNISWKTLINSQCCLHNSPAV